MSLMKLRHQMISNARTRMELASARTKLKQAEKDYAGGNFSGHPEEQLEEIEYQERAVKRLRAVIDNHRVIDYAELDKAVAGLCDLYERARTEGFTDDLRKLATEAQERCISLENGSSVAGPR